MLLALPAHAQVGAKVLPNVDSLDGAAKRIEVGSRRLAACQATILMDQAVQLKIAGAAATVGRPRPLPRDRDMRRLETFEGCLRRAGA